MRDKFVGAFLLTAAFYYALQGDLAFTIYPLGAAIILQLQAIKQALED